ncbi:hypothetical protein AHF37_09769 [Paragonimus kellicotti]|nr:hypothetical protein AHF37_09769 [Paragonimus kellicotti]
MNSSPMSSASTLVNPTGATTQPNSTGSSMWINKLKIVGSGQNWAVAPCEPFYLMGTEPPAPDAALTGAKNLIEHYGLGNAYQKFCSKPLREELSAFLPHLSGNVDVPASVDGSGLMSLIERPPIRGKELRLFAPSQLDHAFRLHPGPLPQEYASLFAAAAPSARHSHRSMQPSPHESGICANPASRLPASAAPGLTNFSRRRRRYEVHRGLGASNSTGTSSGGGSATSFGPISSNHLPVVPPSAMPSIGATHHTASLSATAIPQPNPAAASSGPGASNSSVMVDPAAGSGLLNKSADLPPGLIPVSNPSSLPTNQPDNHHHSQQQHPPPLLAPVHQSSTIVTPRSGHLQAAVGSTPDSSIPGTTGLPAPPVLHSIHAAGSAMSSISYNNFGQPNPGPLCVAPPELGKLSSPGSSPSPDPHRACRSDELDEERRRKKRKEKKRKKEKD